MISLSGWRYEILVKTKKFCLYVKMCNRRKNPKKLIFSACGDFFKFESSPFLSKFYEIVVMNVNVKSLLLEQLPFDYQSFTAPRAFASAALISPRILKESWRAIIIVNVVRRSSVRSFVVRSSFVVRRWCNAFSLSPHDFSERLKIWNFDKNKKVLSRWVDVQ